MRELLESNRFKRILRIKIRENAGFYFFLMASGFLLIFFRSAYAVARPVMYTEDGPWTSSIIYNGLINTCLEAKGSYLVVGNVLLLYLALHTNELLLGANLNYLPSILAVWSYLYYLFLAFSGVIYLKKLINFKARIFLFYAVLLVPMGSTISEMYGRASNIGYGMFYLAFVISVWFLFCANSEDGPVAVWEKALNYFLLVLCAVTNPVCYLLLIFALFTDGRRCLTERKIRGATPALLAGVGTALSLMLMYLHKRGDIMQPAEGIRLSGIIEYLFRSWLYPFLWPFYQHMDDVRAAILLILAVAFNIYIYIQSTESPENRRSRELLLYSYICLAGFTVITLFSRKTLTWQLVDYVTSFPDRYFYAQSLLVLFIFSLLVSLALEGRLSKSSLKPARVIGFLCAFSLLLQFLNFDEAFEGMRPRGGVDTSVLFSQRIAEAYAEQGDAEQYLVSGEPDAWKIALPREYVTESVKDYADHYHATCAELTDVNWEMGVSCIDHNVLLFPYESFLRYTTEQSSLVVCGDNTYEIKSVFYDEQWIRVTVDRDASACMYPAVITFE